MEHPHYLRGHRMGVRCAHLDLGPDGVSITESWLRFGSLWILPILVEDGSHHAHLHDPHGELGKRFVFDQWICSEQNYDAGALFISVNNGSWTHFDQPGPGNQTTWYDGTMANNLGATLHNLNVWDGRSNGAGCSSATSASWRSMEADLTPYSGSDLRFRFTFESDSIIAYDGWFLDDIGVEIDYFVENGTWTSPLIPWDDLGLGIVDLDAVLPENTSPQATVTDASGAVIHGFEDLDLPFSLAGVRDDKHR